MKRAISKLLVAPLACLLVLSLIGISNAGITGSAHDFSGTSWAEGQICLPCHTPHFATKLVDDAAPLWNHEVTTATYTLYSSATLDATLEQPSGVSKLCLSCHDGTVALDSFGGATGSVYIASQFNVASSVGGSSHLSDDHPISFVYNSALATADGGLFDPTAALSGLGGTIDSDLLINNKLQCTSCHDVHNSQNQDKLLVKSNDGSALCKTCHSK